MKKFVALVLLALAPFHLVSAGIIATYTDDAAFFAATGASSLTGPLPDIGNQGTTVTLGDATLSAANDIFVGSGWSTLIPGGSAVAISDREDIDVAIGRERVCAFGMYFHEPTTPDVRLDGCNASECINSRFLIDFLREGDLLDTQFYDPFEDRLRFLGMVLDEVFDLVRITEIRGSIDNEFFGEMYVAQVAEPGTLALLGGGLLGLVLLRRKRS